MFIGDVSSYNNVTDWFAYVRDTPAVWCKATQSSGAWQYVNPRFGDQFNGALNAGGLVGAYHFADVRNDPAADAGHFVAMAGAATFRNGRLLPLLDVENTTDVHWTAGNAPAWIRGFINRYRELTGRRKIIVYASRSFWQTIMQPDLWADSDVYLMVAAYNGSIDWSHGLNQSGWSHPRLAVWQYTDVAPIAGMQRPGDRSVQVAFTQADLTLGAALPIEGDDDDMALEHQLYAASAVADVNGGQPLFPHGVWRDDQGVYQGIASDGERQSRIDSHPSANRGPHGDGIWLEQATLADLIRISRVGVDTPVPTAQPAASTGTVKPAINTTVAS